MSYALLTDLIHARAELVDRMVHQLTPLRHRKIGCSDRTAVLDLLRQLWLLDHGPDAEHGVPCDHAKRAKEQPPC